MSIRSRRAVNSAAYYLGNGLLAFLFLSPILWALITALKPRDQVLTYPPQFIPQPATLESFVKLWDMRGGVYQQYTLNSLIVAVATTLLVILVATAAGYGFSRLRFAGKQLFFVVILSTLMIPYHSILVPLFVLMKNLGLLNTYWSLILVYTTFQLPLAVFIMKNSFDAIPAAIGEAALIDGCNPFQVFRRIMVPLVGTGVATVAVLVFMWAWNEFLIALVFTTREELRTLPVGLTDFIANYTIEWDLMMAGALYSGGPIIILFILLQRYFIKGMMQGAIR